MQLTSYPTNDHNNTLDLVIVPRDSHMSPTVSVIPVSPSDHLPVLSHIRISSKPHISPPVTQTYRRIRSIDLDAFTADLKQTSLIISPPDDLDELVSTYNTTLYTLLDKHAPLINRPTKSRPQNPWFTPRLAQLKRTRRRFQRSFKLSPDSYHLSRLRQITGFYHSSILKAKKAYHAQLVNDSRSNPRKLWQTINTLLHRSAKSVLPSTISPSSLSHTFASFFKDKVSTLHRNLLTNAHNSSTATHPNPPHKPAALDSFMPTSESEIIKLIAQSPDKQCDLDPIPMSILKHCAHILAPTITKMVNLSLSTGHFPSTFKQATVTPLLKKPSLDKESLSNYRPISNLSFISKITERVIKERLNDHLTKNNMYNAFQSAYTKFHSTETTLLALHDDLIKAMDNKQVSCLTSLDHS